MTYKTEMFQAGRPGGSNCTAEDAVMYTHDVFEAAARWSMDVFMICGSLNDELRDRYYKSANDEDFASSVRKTLAAGGDVSILLWGQLENGRVSSGLRALMEEAAAVNPGWGKLDIRVSNTSSEEDVNVAHFIVARSRDEQNWAVRIEEPHDRYMAWSPTSIVSASVLQDTPETRRKGISNRPARDLGRKLYELFQDVFGSVPDQFLDVNV